MRFVQRPRRAAGATIERFTLGRFLRALVLEVGDDDVSGMAAEMAYRFLFSLFPLLLLLVTSLAFVGDALGLDEAVDLLHAQAAPFLPAPVHEVLIGYVDRLLASRSGTFLTVGILGTLWGAASGVGTLIKGLNRAYDVTKPRPAWRRLLISIATTLTVPPMAILLLVVSLLGRDAAIWLIDALGAPDRVLGLIAALRWPILLLLLFVGLTAIYHVLPNTRHRYVWSLPGSAFATLGWIGLTQGFGLYLRHFGNYEATYGSFGAAMAFLLWLYLAGVIVLLGAELNALLEPTQRKHWRARGADPNTAERAAEAASDEIDDEIDQPRAIGTPG